MARDGEIQNTGILKKMADFLDLGGIRRITNRFNLDTVQPVFDLASVPNASFLFNSCNSGNFPAGTTGTVGVDIVGGAANSSFNPANNAGDFPVSTDKEYKVMSIYAGVGYSAAGAAADAALSVPLSIGLIMRIGASPGTSFPVFEEFAIVENIAPYSYQWIYPQGARFARAAAAGYQQIGSNGSWDGLVPAGHSLELQLGRGAGTGFFPALTTLDVYFEVAVRSSRGDWKA